MSLPDISFENIRPYDGSRHSGFEELCSQLASLETSPEYDFIGKGVVLMLGLNVISDNQMIQRLGGRRNMSSNGMA